MKITLTYHDVHKFRRIDQIPLNTISIILIETIGFEPTTHPLHNDYTLLIVKPTHQSIFVLFDDKDKRLSNLR